MGGTAPSNCTSTTGPITCTTRPTFPAGAFCVAMPSLTPSVSPPSSRRSAGPRDHLDDLLGDGGLPDLVHIQRQALDHVVGVVGGGVHGRHARPVLRGRGLQQ